MTSTRKTRSSSKTSGKSAGSKGPGGGTRALTERVKTARGRKPSSTKWLQRQLNDPYVVEAKRMGLRSRAAFKLSEIDDKHKFLKPGTRVIDLGSTPGGWTQVAVERVGSLHGKGEVVALDINPMDEIVGATFLQMDFLDNAAPDAIIAAMKAEKADVVLSDMAAPASGHKRTDHVKIMGLVEVALDFALQILAPGGTFLAKVLRGGTEHELLVAMKRDFTTVRHVKPKASRADSAETFVLATGFRGE